MALPAVPFAVQVTSTLPDGRVEVRDQTGGHRVMRTDILPARGLPPMPGEMWMVSRQDGTGAWLFSHIIQGDTGLAGRIQTWAGAGDPPPGWIECDGSTLLVRGYPELHNALDGRWGSQGGPSIPVSYSLNPSAQVISQAVACQPGDVIVMTLAISGRRPANEFTEPSGIGAPWRRVARTEWPDAGAIKGLLHEVWISSPATGPGLVIVGTTPSATNMPLGAVIVVTRGVRPDGTASSSSSPQGNPLIGMNAPEPSMLCIASAVATPGTVLTAPWPSQGTANLSDGRASIFTAGGSSVSSGVPQVSLAPDPHTHWGIVGVTLPCSGDPTFTLPDVPPAAVDGVMCRTIISTGRTNSILPTGP